MGDDKALELHDVDQLARKLAKFADLSLRMRSALCGDKDAAAGGPSLVPISRLLKPKLIGFCRRLGRGSEPRGLPEPPRLLRIHSKPAPGRLVVFALLALAPAA
jgi:hypothetical protein